jgi:hypothetical protein
MVTKLTTTGQLMRSLDTINCEITTMQDALRDSRTVADADRRRLRWEVQELQRRAEFLMNWLGESRLEDPKD